MTFRFDLRMIAAASLLVFSTAHAMDATGEAKIRACEKTFGPLLQKDKYFSYFDLEPGQLKPSKVPDSVQEVITEMLFPRSGIYANVSIETVRDFVETETFALTSETTGIPPRFSQLIKKLEDGGVTTYWVTHLEMQAKPFTSMYLEQGQLHPYVVLFSAVTLEEISREADRALKISAKVARVAHGFIVGGRYRLGQLRPCTQRILRLVRKARDRGRACAKCGANRKPRSA